MVVRRCGNGTVWVRGIIVSAVGLYIQYRAYRVKGYVGGKQVYEQY